MGHQALLLAVAGLAVFSGAVVQGSVGFGLGLVAAPLVTILDPTLMPGSVTLVSVVFPVFTLVREWRGIDWRGLGWAQLGRVPGTVTGGFVAVYVNVAQLGFLVAAMVIAAVLVSVRSTAVPNNPGTLAGAGYLSGVVGTATGIGGPPIALVYQDATGPKIRATLAAFFFLSAAQSLVILAVLGRLPQRALGFGAALIPFLLIGYAMSGPVRRYVDGGRVRRGVLVVAIVSAVALLVNSTLKVI
ncbi:sulfite exporter TauE/SafE family protein [Streptosporangiaceae bacterium NEAU-GS5]|nr:sulfite exporter TauE/SafE family protein [Streptosporangiaceae bacterium NEAU-GS5]